MAALRAVTSAAMINNNCFVPGMPPAARNALITAKGNENMVCENLIRFNRVVIFWSKYEKPIVNQT